MNGISFFGNSDMGCVRTNNEDTFVVQNVWDSEHLLAVVVDGVGGYEGGEVAAAIARDTIVEYLGKYPNGERLELLKQAVVNANSKVLAERSNNAKLADMSCVLTAILVEVAGLRVNMVHVGDTRFYQYAYGKLRKLSHDQSVVGYMEDNGLITEAEAMTHPQRNVISRYVGSEQFAAEGAEYVETASFPLVPTSSLMLCSDGLSDLVPSERIETVLSMDITAEEKVGLLIQDAKNAGGKDNITVVVADFALVPADAETEEPDAADCQPDDNAVADGEPDEEQSAVDVPDDRLKEYSIPVPQEKGLPRLAYILMALAFVVGLFAGYGLSFVFNDNSVETVEEEAPAAGENVAVEEKTDEKVEAPSEAAFPVDSLRSDSLALQPEQ